MAGTIGHTVLDDVTNFVSKAAPLLGAVLGSPLASVGISLLSGLFNVDKADTDKLLQTMQGDPDAILKIKTLENQHQEALLSIQSQTYAVEVDDRKSAREMEVSTKSNMPHYLALAFLLIYFTIQICAINHPGQQDDIISARVQDIMVMIVSFYFGSAHKVKDPQ